MNATETKRRSFLFGLGGLGLSRALRKTVAEAQSASAEGYVLGADEGEHLALVDG